MRPTRGGRHDHRQHRAQRPAAEIFGRFRQRAVDVAQREGLQQDHQRQCQRQVADDGYPRRIQHGDRADRKQAQHLVDHAEWAENHLPGIDPHRIAGEKRHDQQKDENPPRAGRHLERERVGSRESDQACKSGGNRRQNESISVRRSEESGTDNVHPVGCDEIRGQPKVTHRPEGHRDQKAERNDEKQQLPNEWRPAERKRKQKICARTRRCFALHRDGPCRR